jgi:mannose-6-phosphate isomerase-like protein (cupin superfamily)
MTEARIVERHEWANPTVASNVWRGLFQGESYGANIAIVFTSTQDIGEGPRLHKHPYVETFIIRTGRARFTVGEQVTDVSEGQIVVCPANVPHKFENLGPGLLEQIDIHEAGAFETVWLE